MEKFEGIGTANLLATKQIVDFMVRNTDLQNEIEELIKFSSEITDELKRRVLELMKG